MIWASLEFESLECELRLDDSRRLHPGPEHVLLRGHVVGAADAVEGVEIVGGAVVELGGDSIGKVLFRDCIFVMQNVLTTNL